MSPGGKADRSDVPGVDFVVLGVSLQPANRGLDVVNLRGEVILGAESVLRRDRHVTPLGELVEDRSDVRLVPPAPAAAVDDENPGKWSITLGRLGHVELQFGLAGLGVNNVVFRDDLQIVGGHGLGDPAGRAK